MLARVAHALFVTARDLERAEGLARALEAAHARALEGNGADGRAGAQVWEPLVDAMGDRDHFLRTHLRADARSVSWTFAFDPEHEDSIAARLARARAHAGGVRDRLPSEVWEAINAAAAVGRAWTPSRAAREGVYPFYGEVRRAGHLIAGVMDHAMRRDEGWDFMCLGRFLERAHMTARQVRVHYGSGGGRVPAPPAWAAPVGDPVADEARLLIDGVGIAPESMSRLLMLDPASPRSAAFCIARSEEAIVRLVAAGAIAPDPAALILARTARLTLEEAVTGPWGPDDVDALADRVAARASSIAEAIADSCFLADHDAPIGRHAQASRQSQN